jgi:alpha,alpha-trehalase
MTESNSLDRNRLDAVIFDLDGVITTTQQLHAEAWKTVFDEAIVLASRREAREIEPFRIETDYYRYVDGKPRYDGVRSFLASRSIEVPEGHPEDPPDADSIFGIGNRKNRRYLELLEHRGAQVYPAALKLVRALRVAGFAVAVVSSSRNCRQVLESVGADRLFHVRIDGNDSETLGLTGKPAPDLFLAAARLLDVAPDRIAVVEDAIAGVRAGCSGGFGRVIGVDRHGEPAALAAAGADTVVDNLGKLEVVPSTGRPPDGLEAFDDIQRRFSTQSPVVFLDYDGTLTPIVDRPEDAVLSTAMKATLTRLAERLTTAIISGRDLEDVRARVGIEGVIYVGSHGLDILLADGTRRSADGAEAFLDALDRAEALLHTRIDGIRGAIVERKRFALTAHYRLVIDTEIPLIEAAVDEALNTTEGLRRQGGKRVIELLPELDWDKGSAVRWLVDQLSEAASTRITESVPVYIGDDITDENVFQTLRVDGVTVAVMDAPHTTAACYSLHDTEAVGDFLDRLTGLPA